MTPPKAHIAISSALPDLPANPPARHRARKSISPLCGLLLPLLLPSALRADDRAYEDALAQALRDYPPGDYSSPPIRRFAANPAPEKFDLDLSILQEMLDAELSRPVEPSNKTSQEIFSEAASYFIKGRWDLAMVRYKQALLQEPGNEQAKANIMDILMLHILYRVQNQRTAYLNKLTDTTARLTRDILIK